MNRNSSETLALTSLGWLAANEDLLPVFLSSTGASLSDLRARASEAEFLGSVLDFLLMDDAWVIALCDAQGWRYTDIAEARANLPGGGETHWT